MNLQLSLLTKNYHLKLSTQFSKLFALYDLLNNLLLSGFGKRHALILEQISYVLR